MKCGYCKCLDINKKKEGCVSGALYYCKLKKDYVYVTDENCNNFEKDFRDKELVGKLLEDSKTYDNIPFSPSTLFLLSAILIIVGLIMGIF